MIFARGTECTEECTGDERMKFLDKMVFFSLWNLYIAIVRNYMAMKGLEERYRAKSEGGKWKENKEEETAARGGGGRSAERAERQGRGTVDS